MKKILCYLLLALVSNFAAAQVLTVTPAVSPGYITPQFVGVHAHNPELAGHYPKIPFGSWRMHDGAGSWPDVQPTSGAFNFTHMDQYMSLIEQTPGTKVLVTLVRTPTWASARPTEISAYQSGNAAEPVDIEAWRLYVRTLATRYKGRVEAYQVWNEANTTLFWTGTVAKLVELTCAAYQEIAAADPAAKVVSPSGTGAYAPNTDFVKSFLDAGGKNCIHIISYHLYTSGSPPENFVIPLMGVRDSLIAAGYGKFPLWNTETGYLTPGTKLNSYAAWSLYEQASRVSDFDASNFVVRSMMLARAIGFERFYTYAWDNAKLGQSDLVSGLSRESAAAITRFYNTFTNGGYIGTCSRSAAGVWTCGVKIGGGGASTNGYVVWVDPSATAQTQTYTLPYTAAVSNFHTDGAPILTRFTAITISASPTLMVWK